jgi:hypothetical protein
LIEVAVDFQTLSSSPRWVYNEALRFFAGKGMINDALDRLVRDLERRNIDYALVGALALNQHGFPRLTVDIDLLLTPRSLERFQDELVGLGYRPAFEGARRKFRTTDENIPVDIITTGEFPGDGKPKPVAFPDPSDYSVMIDGIRTITLEKLIELKLASGMTAGDRQKDLGDVQEMIKIKDLDSTFAERLDPFVRSKYLELLVGVEFARERESDF